MAIVFLLIGLIVFAAIGVPLAFSIGASCISYLSAARPMFLSMMPQRIWNGVYSELMIAMPLFMLAGELMNTGGITKRIISVVNYIVMLVVDILFIHYGWAYAVKMGKQLSMGMEIPMFYMYGLMPVCGVICAVCIVIKAVEAVCAPVSAFENKDKE